MHTQPIFRRVAPAGRARLDEDTQRMEALPFTVKMDALDVPTAKVDVVVLRRRRAAGDRDTRRLETTRPARVPVDVAKRGRDASTTTEASQWRAWARVARTAHRHGVLLVTACALAAVLLLFSVASESRGMGRSSAARPLERSVAATSLAPSAPAPAGGALPAQEPPPAVAAPAAEPPALPQRPERASSSSTLSAPLPPHVHPGSPPAAPPLPGAEFEASFRVTP